MESAAVPAEPTAGAATGEKGLKKDAIGFLDGLWSDVPVLVVPPGG